MKNRLIRVRELLQRELGAILARDHAFPDVLVTVNDVDITPDLKHAYFYIGIIGREHEAQHVVDVLNRKHGDLQSRVCRRVILKNTPQFHFRLDHSIERGVRITRIMESIDRQLAESAAREPGTTAPAHELHEDDVDDDVQELEATEDEAGSADADPDEAVEEDRPAGPARSDRRPAVGRSPRSLTTRDDDA